MSVRKRYLATINALSTGPWQSRCKWRASQGFRMDSEQELDERGPARGGPRDSLFLLTSLESTDGAPLGRARVRNLSATGMMADCERPVPSGITLLMELRGVGRVRGKVIWSRNDKIGVAFDHEIDPQMARKPVAMRDLSRPVRVQLHSPQFKC